MYYIIVIENQYERASQRGMKMGSSYRANCSCGFNEIVIVGGGRMDYLTHSKFPFYCKKCGLVDVNISQTPLCCPTCKSTKIKVYGKPPISLKTSQSQGALRWDSYSAGITGHLCPQCKKHTLSFKLYMMFD